ncbi:hypothetical protein Cantr_02736 [Candida viswanathii]|uniref:Uncharacterized protein n=1 Tax=Candida viswanathii TaxID=5486 RepID=A0A367YNL2_9ASCO|nr:hypothetical protein Cantr_02736 [Candida viswanathii]
MTQRKSRVGSFYMDIEKNGVTDDDKQHKHFKQKLNNGRSDALTFSFFALCLVCSLYFIYSYRSILNNNFQLDQSILLSSSSSVNSPEISILKEELISNYDDVHNGGTGLSLSDEVQAELKHQQYSPPVRVASPAAQKATQEGTLVVQDLGLDDDDEASGLQPAALSKGKSNINTLIEEDDDLEQDPEMHLKVQENLKEIFSINPIIMLSLNNQIDKVHTIIMNMNITPEPKVINLSKHPNYNNIMRYLKKINHSDEENIPRLFLGGSPVGTSSEIVEMFENNELLGYLRAKGQGLINV